MKNNIIIQDWTGNILFDGDYADSDVDLVLDANRCDCHTTMNELEHEMLICDKCNDTGYCGDFSITWAYPELHENENVYEYINY